MENNNIEKNSKKDEVSVEQKTKNLTNEKKLEYLSQLIQNAEQNLENDNTSKKLTKQL